MAGNDSDWFGFEYTGAPSFLGISGEQGQLFSIRELTFGPTTDPISGVTTPARFNYLAHMLSGSIGVGYEPVTTATVFKLNLHGVDFLQIWSNAPGIVGLDNIVLVPESETQTLLILGVGVGLTLFRRR